MSFALRTTLALFAISVIGCTSNDIRLDGEYVTTGVWDLSAPFGRDGIGGAFADLLIEESVKPVVPGLLEEEAIDLTSTLARGPIKDLVESQLPPELKEDGEVLLGLKRLLPQVNVETTMNFQEDERASEMVTQLSFTVGDDQILLSSEQLPPGVSLAADIEGDRKGRDRMELEPYNLELRFGELILILVDVALEHDAAGLNAQTQNAIACAQIVEAITNADGNFGFEVAGRDFSISGSALRATCDALKDALSQYALGLARLDSGLQLEGQITLLDDDQDLIADRFSSDTEFEGRITLLPGPFEPKFAPNFMGMRR